MKHLDVSKNIKTITLDRWSETYIGARWIVMNVLPDKVHQADGISGSLSQMVLIASHELIEVTLFDCIRINLQREKKWNDVIEKVLSRLAYNQAFNTWPKMLTGRSFAKGEQPFVAARELANRRNATVHSESALATVEMARSALFTGVSASRAIQEHFQAGLFQYEYVLQKYPIDKQELFSNKIYPVNTHGNHTNS